MGNKCGAHTVPYIKNKNSSSTVEHEATASKINEDQLFYCNQRLNQEEAVSLIVNGFCKSIAATTNGICSGGTKISINQLRRERWIMLQLQI